MVNCEKSNYVETAVIANTSEYESVTLKLDSTHYQHLVLALNNYTGQCGKKGTHIDCINRIIDELKGVGYVSPLAKMRTIVEEKECL